MARMRKLEARRMAEMRKLINEMGKQTAESLAAQKEKTEGERSALAESVQSVKDTVQQLAEDLQRTQQGQTDAISGMLRFENEQEVQRIEQTVLDQIRALSDEQQRALFRIESSVDSKLNDLMERRLGMSFSAVSGKLEEISKSIRTISELAETDISKTPPYAGAGNYGEVALESLLSQILAPQQYAANASIGPDGEKRADFVVLMPGQGNRQSVLLPLDCSLPTREYEELCTIMEKGKAEEIQASRQLLESAIRMYARRISERMIVPPYTTDYAILFLPNEGLYAEALHLDGLADCVRRESHIILAGPTTFAALLSSLQLGFRSLAIEQQTERIKTLLESVRTGLGEYSAALSRTQNRLRQAAIEIESVQRQGKRMSDQLTDLPEIGEKEKAEETWQTEPEEEGEDAWD